MIQEMKLAGIDVSKERFDLVIHPSGKRMSFGSSPAQLAELSRRLIALGVSTVGLEASGGYERRLADSLHAAGLDVYLLAPSRVRSYARALAQHAKTDAIDAEMIAAYLAATLAHLKPYRPDPLRRKLSEICAHRRTLLAEKSGLSSQLDTLDTPLVRRMIETRLRTIAQDIASLEKAMAELVRQSTCLHKQLKRLCLVNGVGPILATTLLADMPELGKISAKAAAALLGVAPFARQSGNSTRAGRCSGGRKHLRDIAYMAVLSTIRAKDQILFPFYRRLRTKGKPFKLAMIATIRKLITILNAIAKSDPAFQA